MQLTASHYSLVTRSKDRAMLLTYDMNMILMTAYTDVNLCVGP